MSRWEGKMSIRRVGGIESDQIGGLKAEGLHATKLQDYRTARTTWTTSYKATKLLQATKLRGLQLRGLRVGASSSLSEYSCALARSLDGALFGVASLTPFFFPPVGFYFFDELDSSMERRNEFWLGLVDRSHA